MGSTLVRFGVRQQARPKSISKRAPPLGHLSVFRINRLRAVAQLTIPDAGGGAVFFSIRHSIQQSTCELRDVAARNCVRP